MFYYAAGDTTRATLTLYGIRRRRSILRGISFFRCRICAARCASGGAAAVEMGFRTKIVRVVWQRAVFAACGRMIYTFVRPDVSECARVHVRTGEQASAPYSIVN